MRSRKTILLAAALACVAAPVAAQTYAPGLWQHTMSIKGGQMAQAMAEMQQQLAALPPEQRKQMEQMMAQRGIGVGAQGTTVKVCVTKEEAARMAEPQFRDGCKQQVVQRSGSKLKVKFECGPQGLHRRLDDHGRDRRQAAADADADLRQVAGGRLRGDQGEMNRTCDLRCFR